MTFLSAPASIGTRAMARVDPAAIAHNLDQVRRRMGSGGPASQGPRVWASIKADAYGHGIHHVVPALSGADGLSISRLADVAVCRDAGWQGPILVLGGLQDLLEVAYLDQPGLHLVISNAEQLDWLAARPLHCPPPWLWLRYVGDLGVIGLDYATYRAAYARCEPWLTRGDIAGIGHFQHYATADLPIGIAAAQARFRTLTAKMTGPHSTSASAAIQCHPEHAANTHWIRPGRLLYGLSPLPDRTGAQLGLRPALSMRAPLVAVHDVAAGTPLGYHGAFVAPTAMRVGVVNCGYAQGYPGHPPVGLPVLVNGRPARGLGQVMMEHLLVDLGDHPDATPGTPVILWGAPELPTEQVAAACGRTAAELLTGLTGRVPIRTS